MVPVKILSSITIFNIDNNKNILSSKSLYLISKGSRDTEDWSNGCWKFSVASQKKVL